MQSSRWISARPSHEGNCGAIWTRYQARCRMLPLKDTGNWCRAKAARLDSADNCSWTRAPCHTLDQVRKKELPNLFSGAIPRGTVAGNRREGKEPLGLTGFHLLICQLPIIQVTSSCTHTAWILHRTCTKISAPNINTTTNLQPWSKLAAKAAIIPRAFRPEIIPFHITSTVRSRSQTSMSTRPNSQLAQSASKSTSVKISQGS